MKEEGFLIPQYSPPPTTTSSFVAFSHLHMVVITNQEERT